jgi:hypothetical protein
MAMNTHTTDDFLEGTESEIDEDLEQILLESKCEDPEYWDELARLEREYGVEHRDVPLDCGE